MNRLNKIFLSFVLPFFCLFISVSYAEYDLVPVSSKATISNTSTSDTIAGYTIKQISNFFKSSDIESRNSMLEAVETAGYYVLWIPYNANFSSFWTFIYPTNSTIDIGGYTGDSGYLYFYPFLEEGNTFYFTTSSSTSGSLRTATSSGYLSYYSSNSFALTTFNSKISADEKFFGNVPYIKQLSSNSGYYWDGTSYYKTPTIEEPEEQPTIPTNSEIAQTVQAFYNSDYYKNSKNFKDFIVMYNYNTGYFSFICHNYEDKFQQLIFPEGYKHDQQWWKFGLDGLSTEISSYLWNKYYWLYSTNDFGANFTYNGNGFISDLLDLHFTTASIIVYSSNDYDVVYYTYNENNELISEMDTMPGDQYTYDENLDPTTNEYNPLKDFIPTNPTQSLLGNVDFSEINKTFEENKDILNIEGASWLFTANNKLVGYFIGFLSLLIVFLIISRILGG